MLSRHSASLQRLRGPLLALSLPALAVGCLQFEEPLADLGDTEVDPAQRKDGSVARDVSYVEDAGEESDAEPELDASEADSGVDAEVDAGVQDAGKQDAMVPIPKRPANLPNCNFAAPINASTITDTLLNEISGLVPSRKNQQIIWVVEDSGNGSSVHAVNQMGQLKATYSVSGGGFDMEDIAVGPGPVAGASYLYIADIGDNSASREHVTILRAPEPEVGWDQAPISGVLSNVEPLNFKFPSGKYNAETVMVDTNQDIYLVTKEGFSGPNMLNLLAAPQVPFTVRTTTELGGLYAGVGIDIAITSGDISADGKRVVVRSLRAAQHWTRATGVSIADTLLKGTPCNAPLSKEESQGESIGFSDTGYFSISEGTSPVMHFVSFTK